MHAYRVASHLISSGNGGTVDGAVGDVGADQTFVFFLGPLVPDGGLPTVAEPDSSLLLYDCEVGLLLLLLVVKCSFAVVRVFFGPVGFCRLAAAISTTNEVSSLFSTMGDSDLTIVDGSVSE